jgi:hypothetical protein
MTDPKGSDKPKLPFDAESLLLIDDHEEEVSVDGKTVRKRGIYLLPNLFTTAALFAGFFAIISGMHGNFENAAIAIFVAMILDGLDGRVARLMNAQSKFGAEYDSLSDMGCSVGLWWTWVNLVGRFRLSMWPVRPCVWRALIPRLIPLTKITSLAWPVLRQLQSWLGWYGSVQKRVGLSAVFLLS